MTFRVNECLAMNRRTFILLSAAMAVLFDFPFSPGTLCILQLNASNSPFFYSPQNPFHLQTTRSSRTSQCVPSSHSHVISCIRRFPPVFCREVVALLKSKVTKAQLPHAGLSVSCVFEPLATGLRVWPVFCLRDVHLCVVAGSRSSGRD